MSWYERQFLQTNNLSYNQPISNKIEIVLISSNINLILSKYEFLLRSCNIISRTKKQKAIEEKTLKIISVD